MGRVKRRHGVHGDEASRGEGRREAQDKKVWYGPRIEPAPREGGAVKSGTPRRIGRAASRGYKKKQNGVPWLRQKFLQCIRLHGFKALDRVNKTFKKRATFLCESACEDTGCEKAAQITFELL